MAGPDPKDSVVPHQPPVGATKGETLLVIVQNALEDLLVLVIGVGTGSTIPNSSMAPIPVKVKRSWVVGSQFRLSWPSQ